MSCARCKETQTAPTRRGSPDGEHAAALHPPATGIALVDRGCTACADEAAAERASDLALRHQGVDTAGALTPPSGPPISGGQAARIERLEGAGIGLKDDERRFYEARFGRDFSDVRLHTGGPAGQLARAVEAHAFTFGRNVVLGDGVQAAGPGTERRVLAHELAHVIQQRSAGQPAVQRWSWNEAVSKPYAAVKEKAYGAMIAGLRAARNTAMNALRARVPRLPPQFQSAANGLIYVLDMAIEILFMIWFAVIGMVVGFSEGIVDLVKGILTLGYGLVKLLYDLAIAGFDGAEALKSDLNFVLEALKGLPAALKKLATDWLAAFEKAPVERQGLMIGELTGQVLALIATWGLGATRAGTGARAAAGGAEVVEAGAATASKAAPVVTAAPAAVADATTTVAKAAPVVRAATTTAKATPAVEATAGASRVTSTGRVLRSVPTGGGAAPATVAARPAAAASRALSPAAAAPTRVIPPVYSAGGPARAFAPAAEEAAAAGARPQALLRAVPKPVEPVPLPLEPLPVAPPVPAAVVPAPAPVPVGGPAPIAGPSPIPIPIPIPLPAPEEKQKCSPTGLTRSDPIPMTWFKPVVDDWYPRLITLDGREYDRDTLTTLSRGEPIGVSRKFWPRPEKIMQLAPAERGAGADQFRAVLRRYGFDWTGLQADHVQDLEWEGEDDFRNLWPMDQSANMSAGARNNQQVVGVCIGPAGSYVMRTIQELKAMGFYGRYFKIDRVSR